MKTHLFRQIVLMAWNEMESHPLEFTFPDGRKTQGTLKHILENSTVIGRNTMAGEMSVTPAECDFIQLSDGMLRFHHLKNP